MPSRNAASRTSAAVTTTAQAVQNRGASESESSTADPVLKLSTLAECSSSSSPCEGSSSSIGGVINPACAASMRECICTSASVALEAENKPLLRVARTDMRGRVGVDGDSCEVGRTKSPCPCVGVSRVVRRAAGEEATMRECPWPGVTGVAARDIACTEGMTTWMAWRRARRPLVDDEGTGVFL